MLKNLLGSVPYRPELDKLIKEAQKRFEALSPEAQTSQRARQAFGYIVAELFMHVFDNEPTPQLERARAALVGLKALERVLNRDPTACRNASLLIRVSVHALFPRDLFDLKQIITRDCAELEELLASAAPSRARLVV